MLKYESYWLWRDLHVDMKLNCKFLPAHINSQSERIWAQCDSHMQWSYSNLQTAAVWKWVSVGIPVTGWWKSCLYNIRSKSMNFSHELFTNKLDILDRAHSVYFPMDKKLHLWGYWHTPLLWALPLLQYTPNKNINTNKHQDPWFILTQTRLKSLKCVKICIHQHLDHATIIHPVKWGISRW